MTAFQPPTRPAPARPPITYLTPDEVAVTLRVSRMTVYRLIHSGALSAVRIGRSFRIPDRSVRNFLLSAEVVLP